jgi:ACS family hexuronate transporter-like MFS transporter
MRRRWWILALLFAAMMINVLDRQVLSLVAPVIREQMRLSNTDYGVILFCFLLGMTVGQLPAGLMLDRKGPRIGLPFLVAWWSTASLVHAFARSAGQLSLFRFLLGMGECGFYSGGVKVIGRWFPVEERALAGGLFNSGSLAGSVLAPPIITALLLRYGWPAAFWVPSVLGALWIVPWLLVYRSPEAAPGKSLVEEAPVSTGALLACRALWGVVAMRAFGGPVSHFYWYWLPEYLKAERGFSLAEIGLTAWMPFFAGGLGNIGGGWFSSTLIRRGWTVDRARKSAFVCAAALCLAALGVPLAPGAASALALLCAAAFGINAVAANLIGLISDLFPHAALARVTALTGVGDGAMSMLMMLATGYVIDRFSYLPVFVAAGLFPAMALASLFLLVGRIAPQRL